MSDFIIGTRGSLLAVTQSTLIKNELEKISGLTFELKTIKTQGDIIVDKPLWQLEGKDFFTKELDTALLKKEVDLVIHSYKDLGSERPEGIKLGCLPKRVFPNDILLIKKDTVKDLKNINEIIVGTSSPRRIYHIESSLKEFIPANSNANVKCKMLRGNVNTRIEKLNAGNYHAIVLAMAGLERLCLKEDSKEVLKGLLSDHDFMILPQKEFTSAASQGVLAIETNEDCDPRLKDILSQIHCEKTASDVGQERKIFNQYGGGCHLALGVYSTTVNKMPITFQKGTLNNNLIYSQIIERDELEPHNGTSMFLGMSGESTDSILRDEIIDKEPMSIDPPNHAHLFVTSSHCHEANFNKTHNLWSSGIRSLKKLVKHGYWVNGCADSLGHQVIESFQSSELIKLLSPNRTWLHLSHDKSTSKVGETLTAYNRRIREPSDEFSTRIENCSAFYWTSYTQFQDYLLKFPSIKTKTHACGLGKTLEAFRQNGQDVVAFDSVLSFKKFYLQEK